MADIVYAITNAWVSPVVFIHRGEVWAANDPVVKAHPECFTRDGAGFIKRTVAEPPVEQATAAPGEKRAVRRTH